MTDIPPDAIPADAFDSLDTPSEDAASGDVTCPDCDRSFSSLGGMRRHRTRIHGTSESGGDAKPKSVATRNKTNIERELAQWFAFIGMAAGWFNEVDGVIIVQNAERLAHAWANLCRQNKAVEKVILSLLQTSAVGEVVMTTCMVALPIMANHEMVPQQLVAMFMPRQPPGDGE